MYKKFLLVTLVCLIYCLVSGVLEVKAITNSDDELNFATNYFKILYEYDIQATKFAHDTVSIDKTNDMTAFFQNQSNYVGNVIKKLETLKAIEKYNKSYAAVMKGLKLQSQYLNNLITEINNGSTFEKAFAMNNWSFYEAQKEIQNGVEDLTSILNSYTVAVQFKILAGIELNEDQLRQNAENCEAIKQLQQGL